MKRKYSHNLLNWYKKKDRMPLILRGARQVGKSTLVRLFAQENNLDLLEINLEKLKFRSLEKEVFKIENWLLEIELICQKKISPRSVLFFDEIQAQPIAISRLRYFYEERPDLAVVAAGSLLELALHQNEISFPVGRVTYLWVSPMTFTEYLKAVKLDQLNEFILNNEIPDFAHDKINEEVKKYFFIGGMPKAIQTYIDTSSFIGVREIQSEILESYYNDFPKYERRAQIEKLNSVFQNIPFHLGKKLIYQKLDSELKSTEIKKCIQLFQRANLITPCYHSLASGQPLRATIDQSVFKIYFLDIGLINAAHKLSWHELDNEFENSFVTKGFLAEQFIAQHLSYSDISMSGPETLFWLKDKTLGKAEIDFLVSITGNITPIEVKAGKGGRLKSFEIFAKEKKNINPKITKGIKFSKEYFFTEKIKIDEKFLFEIENWPYYSIEGFIKNRLLK